MPFQITEVSSVVSLFVVLVTHVNCGPKILNFFNYRPYLLLTINHCHGLILLLMCC